MRGNEIRPPFGAPAPPAPPERGATSEGPGAAPRLLHPSPHGWYGHTLPPHTAPQLGRARPGTRDPDPSNLRVFQARAESGRCPSSRPGPREHLLPQGEGQIQKCPPPPTCADAFLGCPMVLLVPATPSLSSPSESPPPPLSSPHLSPHDGWSLQGASAGRLSSGGNEEDKICEPSPCDTVISASLAELRATDGQSTPPHHHPVRYGAEGLRPAAPEPRPPRWSSS